jgi:hypothetical protein
VVGVAQAQQPLACAERRPSLQHATCVTGEVSCSVYIPNDTMQGHKSESESNCCCPYTRAGISSDTLISVRGTHFLPRQCGTGCPGSQLFHGKG